MRLTAQRVSSHVSSRISDMLPHSKKNKTTADGGGRRWTLYTTSLVVLSAAFVVFTHFGHRVLRDLEAREQVYDLIPISTPLCDHLCKAAIPQLGVLLVCLPHGRPFVTLVSSIF